MNCSQRSFDSFAITGWKKDTFIGPLVEIFASMRSRPLFFMPSCRLCKNGTPRDVATLRFTPLPLPICSDVKLPSEPWKQTGLANHHTWHQFVIRAKRRDELLRYLTEAEIGHAVYYPVPLHLQECFAFLGYQEGDFPEAERAAREAVALPIFPGLRDEEIEAVVRAIRRFYAR